MLHERRASVTEGTPEITGAARVVVAIAKCIRYTLALALRDPLPSFVAELFLLLAAQG